MKPPSKRNNTGHQSKAAKAGFSPQQLLLEGGEPGGLSPAPHTKARALEGWGLKEFPGPAFVKGDNGSHVLLIHGATDERGDVDPL